jgi:hypothetical protein
MIERVRENGVERRRRKDANKDEWSRETVS